MTSGGQTVDLTSKQLSSGTLRIKRVVEYFFRAFLALLVSELRTDLLYEDAEISKILTFFDPW